MSNAMSGRDDFDNYITATAQGMNAETTEAARLAQEQLVADIKKICGRPEGIRFMRWLFDFTGLFEHVSGPEQIGARYVGVSIFKIIRQAAPDKAGKIIKE